MDDKYSEAETYRRESPERVKSMNPTRRQGLGIWRPNVLEIGLQKAVAIVHEKGFCHGETGAGTDASEAVIAFSTLIRRYLKA